MAGPTKVLILKPSSLGDIVHALPVLRLIKRHQPKWKVYWWVDSTWSPLLQGDPDLDGLFLFERRRWASPRCWGEMWASLQSMRELRLDWAVDLQGLARSALFAKLARSAAVIGVDDPREGACAFYDYIVARPSFHSHAVDWYLGALPLLNVPIEPLSGDDWIPPRPEVADAVRARWALDKKSWIVLLPGARWPNKRWPALHFADLAASLTARHAGMHVVVLGGTADRETGAMIAKAAPDRCLNLCGETTLPEMVEWIRLGALTVANDTGPMHVAAALGRPLVALFGPTEPRRTGPYGQLSHVLRRELPCAPCLKDQCHWKSPIECLHSISVETVAREACARLNLPW